MLLSVINDEKKRKRAESCLLETKEAVQYDPNRIEEKIISGSNILSTILGESKNYDLILIGASQEGLWKRVRFGTIPEKLTRKSPVSVLVVKKYERGIFTWIRRFLAG
jgi:nucleotide-binding universal stress UspA family protein